MHRRSIMPHEIKCDLKDLPDEPDFPTWVSIYKSHLKNNSFDKIMKLYTATRALRLIEKKIDNIKPSLPIEIQNSPAFVTVFENLQEYILNSIDADANQIVIHIPNESINGEIILTLLDNGTGFKKEFLNNEEILDYGKKLQDKLKIRSDKSSAINLGGAGAGLGVSYHFLKHCKGNLFISNQVDKGAKIDFISPPGNHTPLNRQFNRMRRCVIEDIDAEQSIQLVTELDKKNEEKNDYIKEFTMPKSSDEKMKLDLGQKGSHGLERLTIDFKESRSKLMIRTKLKTGKELNLPFSSETGSDLSHSPKFFTSPKFGGSPTVEDTINKDLKKMNSP